MAGGEQQFYKEALLKSTMILYLSFTHSLHLISLKIEELRVFHFPKPKLLKYWLIIDDTKHTFHKQ